MHLAQIHRYPVKGLGPQSLAAIALTAGAGLPRDRLFALAHGRSRFREAAPAPVAKTEFVMLMRDAGLASLTCTYDEAATCVSIARAGAVLVEAPLDDTVGRAAIAGAVEAALADPARGTLTLVSAPDQMLSDVGAPLVSLINLATVRAVADAAGQPVDPVRFRGNLLIDDVPPWREFDWLGQTLEIGGARLEAVDRIRRCAATAVNPTSGVRDLNVPALLQKNFGHCDCGIYARVAVSGKVKVGDPLAGP